MLKTTLAFATDRFEPDPNLPPSIGGFELLTFLLDAMGEAGHEPLLGAVDEGWGASCRVRIEGVDFELLVAIVDAESAPPVWWAQIAPVDSRSLWERLRRVSRATTPPHVAEVLEDAVRTIPEVQDVVWYDAAADGPPTLF